MKKIFFALALLLLIAIVPHQAQASPIVRVDVSNYEPFPARPGEIHEVWITVMNTGTTDARNIQIEFLDTHPFRLIEEQHRVRNIPILGTQADYRLRYLVQVDRDAVEGRNNLVLRYNVENQPLLERTVNLPLQIRSSEVLVSVVRVETTPQTAMPGEELELTLAIRNQAASALRDFTVNLDLEDRPQAEALPFVPVRGTNQKSINRISPEQTTEFTFTLMAYPNAQAGPYKIPVTMTFHDEQGQQYERVQIVGLQILSQPDFLVTIDSSDLNTERTTGDVSFSIVNRGLSNSKLVTVELLEGQGYEVIGNHDTVYLGNIDTDDFDTARFRVRTTSSNPEYNVRLVYKDSSNNPYEEDFVVAQTLRDPTGASGLGMATILILLIIAGGIIYWVYRRRKKKKEE